MKGLIGLSGLKLSDSVSIWTSSPSKRALRSLATQKDNIAHLLHTEAPAPGKLPRIVSTRLIRVSPD